MATLFRFPSAGKTGRSADDMIRSLRGCGLDVPSGLPEKIRSLGEAAVEPLCGLLTDETLYDVEGPESWGPIHALHLLAAIGDPRSAEAFERAVHLDQEYDLLGDWMWDVGLYLGGLGRPAMDPARRIVKDLGLDAWHRGEGLRAIEAIGSHHPELREEITFWLILRLRAEGDREFAAMLVEALAPIPGREVEDEIERAFLQKRVDRDFVNRKQAAELRKETPWLPRDSRPMDHFSEASLERLRRVNETEDPGEVDDDQESDEEAAARLTELLHREAMKAAGRRPWQGDRPVEDEPTKVLVAALRDCGMQVPEGVPEELVRRGEKSVPDLCRMVRRLRRRRQSGERDRALPHAMRVLAAIGGDEALSCIVETMRARPAWISPDSALAASGALAYLAPLGEGKVFALVEDPRLGSFPRYVAAAGLYAHGVLHPERRGPVEALLLNLYERGADSELNDLLLYHLGQMNTPEARRFVLRSLDKGEHSVEPAEQQEIRDLVGSSREEWQAPEAAEDPMAFFSAERLVRTWTEETAMAMAEVTSRWAAEGDEDPYDDQEDLDDEEEWSHDDLEMLADEEPVGEPLRVVKIGRNDPCPCGSGRKYKKCCHRKDAAAAQNRGTT